MKINSKSIFAVLLFLFIGYSLIVLVNFRTTTSRPRAVRPQSENNLPPFVHNNFNPHWISKTYTDPPVRMDPAPVLDWSPPPENPYLKKYRDPSDRPKKLGVYRVYLRYSWKYDPTSSTEQLKMEPYRVYGADSTA